MLSNIRFAVRSLRQSPGFSLIVVAILAIGIGANTAIFTVVNAFLLQPLAYDKPEELVTVYESAPKLGLDEFSVSGPKYLIWRKENTAFQDMGAMVLSGKNLTGSGQPLAVDAIEVTPSLLQLLKVRPLLGRTFKSDEDEAGKNQVVILGYTLWRQRFAGRQDVLNATIRLDGVPHTIIGVMPLGLQSVDRDNRIFIPLGLEKLRRGPDLHYFIVTARLKPDVSIAQAQSSMTALANTIKQKPGFQDWDVGIRSTHENLLKWEFPDRRSILLLQGTVAMVLLLVCANIANLLLARAASRRTEIALRLALGASRWQVMQPLLIESLILALLGGALGMLLAKIGIHVGEAWLHAQGKTLWAGLQLDPTVLLVCTVISAVTGIAFGWMPAWRAAKLDPQPVLKEGGRSAANEPGQRRLLAALTVAQVGLALMLLIAAGLLVRNLSELMNRDQGFNPDRVLTARIGLTELRYPTDEQRNLFVTQALERLRNLPGVETAAAADIVPLSGASTFGVWFDGPLNDGQLRTAQLRRVSQDYFRVLDMPVLRGRTLSADGAANGPSDIVVSEMFVRKFLKGKEALGVHVYTGDQIGNPHTIVGIVKDQRTMGSEEILPMAYVSRSAGWFKGLGGSQGLHLLVRTHSDPMALAKTVQEEIRRIDPDIAFSYIRPLNWFVGMSVLGQRMSSFVLTSFSLIAMLLAALGVYGVMANSVAGRTRELGIRMALGAERGQILRLVVRYGLTLTVAGIAVGLSGAFAFSRVLQSFLTGISPTDPLVFAGVTILLLGAALIACWLPARRAARVDPIVVLRAD